MNGIRGVTGMQYANTSRQGEEANNAEFLGSAVVRVSAQGGVVRGQPVLIPYDWSAATWEEIDSKVVGVCAYEERACGQGLGDEGGTYVIELASALRRGGIATQMIREARAGWDRGKGRVELQVHVDNRRGVAYYEGLGMRRCRWWEAGRGGEEGLRSGEGGSLYVPRANYQMMQVGAEDLEQELDRREARWGPPQGVEYVRVKGVKGLKEAGVLKGVRAMVARVYGGEGWYVNDEGGTGRVECLYESKRRGGRDEVMFIVARMVDGEGWAASRTEGAMEARARDGVDTGEGEREEGDIGQDADFIGQEDPNRCPNGPLNNTPGGVNQRTGEGAGDSGARTTGAATTAGRAADERAGTAAAMGVAGGGMVVGEREGEGEARDGATDGGARGRREVERVGGTDEVGRKRGREGRGDTMDQEGGKRRKGDDSVKGGVKRKRGDG